MQLPIRSAHLYMPDKKTRGHSGLAEKLQTEFKDDKVEIINAAFNSYSGDLELDLDFSEADAGV